LLRGACELLAVAHGADDGPHADAGGRAQLDPEESPVHVRRSEITIAKLLQQSGYATCHSGKWHMNGEFNQPTQPQPGDHGFDHWFSTQNNAYPNHHNPDNFVRNGTALGKLEGYAAHLVADEALGWLDTRDKTKPFFALRLLPRAA
jgi:arylsulfatase A